MIIVKHRHGRKMFLAPASVFEMKLVTFTTLLSFLESEGIFKPQVLEVWRDSINESEGGTKLLERKLPEGIKPLGIKSVISSAVKSFDPRTIIVRLEGTVRNHAGFIELYNVPELLRIYGDIVFDVYSYPSKGITNALDVIIKESLLSKIQKIIEQIGMSQPKPDIIVLSKSIDGLWDFTERVSFYSPDKKRIVTDILRTLRVSVKRREELRSDKALMKLVNSITPYKEEYLAKLMFEERGFTRILKELARKASAKIVIKKSVLFMGENEGSGVMFYKGFVDRIIRPLAESLIGEDALRQLLKKIIGGQTTLF